jgi:6-phosphogluconolactonase
MMAGADPDPDHDRDDRQHRDDRRRDHRHLVVVGSYASAVDAGIHVVEVDTSSGRMALLARVAGVANPSYLGLTPDGTGLYAVSETGAESDGRPGRVCAFAVDRGAGTPSLSATADRASEGDHPCHVTVDRAGRWLAVSNYGSGSFSVLAISPHGGFGATAAVVQHHGSGPIMSRQLGPHVHAAAFSPDGDHLVVADLGADRVVLYAFDQATGSLEHRHDGAVAPGAGPRHLVIHPAGRLVVVANELASSVSTYGLDPAAGRLTAIDTHPTLPAPAPDNLVAAIRLSTTGDRLYVTNRGHDSIAVFDLDRGGGLTARGVFPCGGRWPRDMVALPDGRHLVVANEHSHHLALLPLSPDGSDVGPPVARLEIPSPTCVVSMG